MRAIAEATAAAQNEEIAVAAATAVMRSKLGWSSDSDARTEVVARFAPVTKQVFASLVPADDEEAPRPDVARALADFEAWYR